MNKQNFIRYTGIPIGLVLLSFSAAALAVEKVRLVAKPPISTTLNQVQTLTLSGRTVDKASSVTIQSSKRQPVNAFKTALGCQPAVRKGAKASCRVELTMMRPVAAGKYTLNLLDKKQKILATGTFRIRAIKGVNRQMVKGLKQQPTPRDTGNNSPGLARQPDARQGNAAIITAGSGADADNAARQRERENRANEALGTDQLNEAMQDELESEADKLLTEAGVSTRTGTSGRDAVMDELLPGQDVSTVGPGDVLGNALENSGAPEKSLDGANADGANKPAYGGAVVGAYGVEYSDSDGFTGPLPKSEFAGDKLNKAVTNAMLGIDRARILANINKELDDLASGDKPGSIDNSTDSGTSPAPSESNTPSQDKKESTAESNKRKTKGFTREDWEKLSDKMSEAARNTPEGQRVDVQYKGKTFTAVGSKKADGSDPAGTTTGPGPTLEERKKWVEYMEGKTRYLQIKQQSRLGGNINPSRMGTNLEVSNPKLDQNLGGPDYEQGKGPASGKLPTVGLPDSGNIDPNPNDDTTVATGKGKKQDLPGNGQLGPSGSNEDLANQLTGSNKDEEDDSENDE